MLILQMTDIGAQRDSERNPSLIKSRSTANDLKFIGPSEFKLVALMPEQIKQLDVYVS